MSKARPRQAQPGDGDAPPPQPTQPIERQRQVSGAPGPPEDQPGDLAPPVIDEREFEAGFGESLDRTLDLDTWSDGRDLSVIFDRLDEEVGQALEQEDALRGQVRKVLLPVIASRPNAPKGAGVFRATRKQLETTQSNVLLNGGVEACDGTCSVHDTLPLTITQIGVCLVSYLGGQGGVGPPAVSQGPSHARPRPADGGAGIAAAPAVAGGNRAGEPEGPADRTRPARHHVLRRTGGAAGEMQGTVANGARPAGALRIAHRLRQHGPLQAKQPGAAPRIDS